MISDHYNLDNPLPVDEKCRWNRAHIFIRRRQVIGRGDRVINTLFGHKRFEGVLVLGTDANDDQFRFRYFFPKLDEMWNFLYAWEGTTQYTLRKAASGFFRSMMSGEGIVAEFTGPGELLIQTRNLAALAGLLKPFFPSQGGGSGGFNLNLGG